MAGNIDVELYLAVGEMKPVSPNFNPPTLNHPIFAYSILSPNIIPANISGHTVSHAKTAIFIGAVAALQVLHEKHTRPIHCTGNLVTLIVAQHFIGCALYGIVIIILYIIFLLRSTDHLTVASFASTDGRVLSDCSIRSIHCTE